MKLHCSDNVGEMTLKDLYAKGWRLINLIRSGETVYYINLKSGEGQTGF
jgi:hypothetical protein